MHSHFKLLMILAFLSIANAIYNSSCQNNNIQKLIVVTRHGARGPNKVILKREVEKINLYFQLVYRSRSNILERNYSCGSNL